MPHLAWLILLLPLACGCERCDWSWVCFGVAGLLATALFYVLAISRELINLLPLLKR
ncbi:MAG: hypothetical protein SF172_15830 [Burkholderiales bacterium]|nr:hypothetical protein [Burkholderiales bacterium]